MKSTRKRAQFYVAGLVFLVSLVISETHPAEGVGHIQIKCEPGIYVFLNENYYNQTIAELNGLIIQDVPAGRHKIKAVKDGFQPIEKEIDLLAGQVLLIEFTSFTPRIETYEEGEAPKTGVTFQTGKIIMQSLPLECSINIPSLDIFGLSKIKDRRVLDKVPAGVHEIEFMGMGKTLHQAIELKGDETINIMVNFLRNEISVNGKVEIAPASSQATQTPQASPPAILPLVSQFTPLPVSQGTSITSLAPENILFLDTFTAEDRTRPANWRIFYAPETEYWYIFDQQFCTGNGDNIPGKGGYSWAIIDVPGAESWADYSLQASLWVRQANGRSLLIARYQDEDNFYAGVFETFQGDRYLRITKVENGAWSALASLKNNERGMTLPALENGKSSADSQDMIFSLTGANLRLSIGDNAFLEVEDHSFKQGTCGLGQWYYFVFFDNVVVKSLAAGVASASNP